MPATTKARAVKKTAKKATGAQKRTVAKAKTNGKRPMSAAHKGALAEGREQAAVVREYLEALEAHKPRRGRRVSPDDVRKRITALTMKAQTASPVDRLHLVQARLDLEARLEEMEVATDIAPLEKQFVRVAKKFAARKKISYTAFREIGVSPAVLKEAGISRFN